MVRRAWARRRWPVWVFRANMALAWASRNYWTIYMVLDLVF